MPTGLFATQRQSGARRLGWAEVGDPVGIRDSNLCE